MGRVTRWIRSAVQVLRVWIGVPTKQGNSKKYQEKKRKKTRSFRFWLFRRRGKDGCKASLPRLPSELSVSDTAISLGESRDVDACGSNDITKSVSQSSPRAVTSPTVSSESTSSYHCHKHLTVPQTKEGNTPSIDCRWQECDGSSTPEKRYKCNELNYVSPTSSEAHIQNQSQVAIQKSSDSHIPYQNQVASVRSSDLHIKDQSQAACIEEQNQAASSSSAGACFDKQKHVAFTKSKDTHVKDESQVAFQTSSDSHMPYQSQVASVKSSDLHIQDQSQAARIEEQSQVVGPTLTDIHIMDTESSGQTHVPEAVIPATSDGQKVDAMSIDKSRKPRTSSSPTSRSIQECSSAFGAPFNRSTSEFENLGTLSGEKLFGSSCERQVIHGKRILNVKFQEKVKVKVMKVGTRHYQKVNNLTSSASAQPDKSSIITDDESLKQDGNLTDVEQRPLLSGSFFYLSDAASEYLRYERSYNELSVHRSESPVSDISDLPYDPEKQPREGEQMYHTARPSALSVIEAKPQTTDPGTDTSLSDSNEHQDVKRFLRHRSPLRVQESRGSNIDEPSKPKESPRYKEQINPDEGSIQLSSQYERAAEKDDQSNHYDDPMQKLREATNYFKLHKQKEVPTILHEPTVSHNAAVSVKGTYLQNVKSQDKVSGCYSLTCISPAQRCTGELKDEPQALEDLTKEKLNTEHGKLESVLGSPFYSSALEWADQCYQLGKDETQKLLFDIYGKDYLTRNIQETPETPGDERSACFSSALEGADQCYQLGKDETQELLFGKDDMAGVIPQKYHTGSELETRRHPSMDNFMCSTNSECRNHGSVSGKVEMNQPFQRVYGIDPKQEETQGHDPSTLNGMPSCLSCSQGLDSALFHASALQWRDQGSNFKTEETRCLLRAIYGHDYFNGEAAVTVQTRSCNMATEELDAAAQKVDGLHPTSSCNTRKIRFSQRNVQNRKQSTVSCGPKESKPSMQGTVLSRQKGIVPCDHALSRKQVRSSPDRWSKLRWSEKKRQTLQEFSDELDYLEGLDSRRIGGDESLYESKPLRKYEKKRKREYQ